MDKTAFKWSENDQKTIGEILQNIQIAKQNRLNSIENFIAYARQRRLSPHNPEFYIIIKSFIKKYSKLADNKSYVYILTCLINKKILAGIIKDSDDLIKYLTYNNEKESINEDDE